MKRKNGSYNSTKKRTLEILASQDSIDVPTLARRVGIHPTRRAYSYLAHLAELDLIVREQNTRGKFRFRITPRGLDRLEWLHSQSESDPIRALAAVFFPSARP